MLEGLEGYQRQEFLDLLNFLQNNIRPDAIVLTNLLIGGVIPQMASNADVWVMLQGDDIFLDSLSASHRTKAVEKMRRLVGPTKGFICHSEAYAASMRELLGIPESKMHVVPLGVAISDFSTAALPGLDPSVSKENAAGTQDDSIHLGYLARMAPEKGLHRLVDAFIELKRNPQWKSLRLSMAGWMGPQHAAYWKEQQAKLRRSGLDGQWEYAGTLSRQQKVEYLSSLDLFCVPTEYADPKGIFLLEAVLAGVPYVMPSHGAFPELHRRIQEFHRQGVAGDLFRPDSQEDLVSKLQRALEQSPKRALPGPGLVSELDISTHAKRLLGLLQGKSVSL
jgi:glycosyltransferase involved in cell wall biosynthesis